MQVDPQRFSGYLFVLAAVLSLLAGIIPMLRGKQPQVLLLILGVVWMVVAVSKLRRRPPPA